MRLIEKVWFKSHYAQWLLVPLLLPFTAIFTVLASLRRLCYSLNIFKSYPISQPVIVVGNIGIGGNGKTPLVILLIDMCRELGLSPGVLSRGYGGKAPYYPYLLHETSSAAEAGDEPVLIYQRCALPVVVGSDRVAGAALLIEQGCDIILADDGLQHYRLQRQLELVVVDGERRFGNGFLLPAGPLREGLWRLTQSDFVVVNGGGNVNSLVDNEIKMQLQATHIHHILTGEKWLISDFISQYTLINAIAGIGSPERFFTTLVDHNFSLNITQGFVDHHDFKQTDFDFFDNIDDTLPLLMTEKDAVKCRCFAKDHWWYLPVDALISPVQLEQLKTSIKQLPAERLNYIT
jgi:tetraacyldisaccharide 4'-kinase